MNILQASCGVFLFMHILDATCTDCTTKIYNSSNGFSCYPCPPGFHVLEECKINATINICIPCPKGTFQPTCSTQATRCAKCGSCPEQNRQKITRNCTRTQDTICACLEEYYWDTDQHVCLSVDKCPPGNKITQGDEGEGLLCVPCEADTFSNRKKSHKCEQCSSCLNYKKNCTKTSDAICHQLTTETATTDKVTTNSNCAHDESCHGVITALIVVPVLLVIVLTVFLLNVFKKRLCKWLDFPCSEKSSQSNQESENGFLDHTEESEKGDTDQEEESEKEGDSDHDEEPEKGDSVHDEESKKGDSVHDEEPEKGDTDHDEEPEKGDTDHDEESEKEGDSDHNEKSKLLVTKLPIPEQEQQTVTDDDGMNMVDIHSYSKLLQT